MMQGECIASGGAGAQIREWSLITGRRGTTQEGGWGGGGQMTLFSYKKGGRNSFGPVIFSFCKPPLPY